MAHPPIKFNENQLGLIVNIIIIIIIVAIIITW